MNLFIPSIEDIENEKNEASSSSLHWKQIKQVTANEKLNPIQNNYNQSASEINNNISTTKMSAPINKNNTINSPVNAPSGFRPASEIVRLGKRIQIPIKQVDKPFNNNKYTEISSEITTEKSTEMLIENSNEKLIIKSTEKVTISSSEKPKNSTNNRSSESPGMQKGKWQDPNANNKAGCSLVISERQRQNPLIKYVTNVRYEFNASITPDFLLSDSTCIIFVSIRYHLLHSDYIVEKTNLVSKNKFEFTILLCLIDTKDDYLKPLQDINLYAFRNNLTLIVVWSNVEAARYIESYKTFSQKPIDSFINPNFNAEKTHLEQYVDCITTVKTVNSTDALTLLRNLGSLKNIMNAPYESLLLCPGLGAKKVKQLHLAFNKPLLTSVDLQNNNNSDENENKIKFRSAGNNNNNNKATTTSANKTKNTNTKQDKPPIKRVKKSAK
jgi:DNA excision repair protein ERCC-1